MPSDLLLRQRIGDLLTDEQIQWQSLHNGEGEVRGASTMADDDAKNAAAAWILERPEAQSDSISAELKIAALRVWPQAHAYAMRELNGSPLADDESIIWEVWELSLQSALKTLKTGFRLRPVRDLDAWVFGIFRRRLRDSVVKEKRYVALGAGLAEEGRIQDREWPDDLDDHLVLQKAISEMDDWMKDVLVQRVIDGVPWKEVGKGSGLTDAEATKRFLYRLKKVRERLFGIEKRGTTDA